MHPFFKLLDTKVQRILRALAVRPDVSFSLQELARASNVSLATTFRILRELERKRAARSVLRGKRRLYQFVPLRKQVLARLLDPKVRAIISVTHQNPRSLLHLQQISQQSGVSVGSTFRIIRKLDEKGFLRAVPIGERVAYQPFSVSRLKQYRRSRPVFKLLDTRMQSVLAALASKRKVARTLQQVSEQSTVPLATTFRILRELERCKVVQVYTGRPRRYRCVRDIHDVALVMLKPKIAAILSLFQREPETLFHLQQISRRSDVSIGSVFRIVTLLRHRGFLQSMQIGKMVVYQLNRRKEILSRR